MVMDTLIKASLASKYEMSAQCDFSEVVSDINLTRFQNTAAIALHEAQKLNLDVELDFEMPIDDPDLDD